MSSDPFSGEPESTYAGEIQGSSKNFKLDPNLVDTKISTATTILHNHKSTLAPDVLRVFIDDKVKQTEGLIQGEPDRLFLDGGIGEIIVDKNGELVIPKGLRSTSQDKILGDYLAVETAVSTLSPAVASADVLSLPPESTELTMPGLSQQIDSQGIDLVAVGNKVEGIKTRFFTIRGQQIDNERKPIPLYKQKVIIVQDTPLPDSMIRRTFSIGTPNTLDESIVDLVAQQDSKVVPESAVVQENTRDQEGDAEQSVLDDANIGQYRDNVYRLADSVLAGSSQPEALQNYATYAVKEGVPKELVKQWLTDKGINVQDKNENSKGNEEYENVRTLRKGLNPIVNKLNTKFPDQPGGIGRMGKEIILTPQELSAMQNAVQAARELLVDNPQVLEVQQLISQYAGKNTAFDQLHFYGKSVQEAPAAQSVRVDRTEMGPIIMVPPEQFKLWQSFNSLDSLNKTLEKGVPPGITPKYLLDSLDKGFQFV